MPRPHSQPPLHSPRPAVTGRDSRLSRHDTISAVKGGARDNLLLLEAGLRSEGGRTCCCCPSGGFCDRLASAFWQRDDEFLDELFRHYGAPVGVYFAFLNNCPRRTAQPAFAFSAANMFCMAAL